MLMSTAAVVILISVISSISLMGIVRFDNMQVQYANDVLQAETFLRSEQLRTAIIMQDAPNIFPNSDYDIEISSNNRVTTYRIDNQPVISDGKNRIGPTLITVKRGRAFQVGANTYKSPVKRYAESVLSGRSLAQYQYFTMWESSENDEYTGDDRVKFWGPDVLNGPVHSNDDIWIQQAGGGNNNGWPTFNALVTTNGRIMNYATGQPAVNSAPMDDIFRGGYIENSAYINISAGKAIDIRAHGYTLDTSLDRDILYVQIDGNTATCRYADIITERDTFTVYNSFPDPEHPNFPVGDSIWTNVIDVKKYDWDDNSFSLNVQNNSVFVHCQLWIEGNISGKMTWGCADTIYITGDITYQSIAPGDPPDEGLCQDMFGLVSEERIYIQYKHRDPVSNEVMSPNCSSIYLYGCYAAIGKGDLEVYGNLNTHYEGIFSFAYQHPHGSTPPFTIFMPNGTQWDVEYPDFHKFIFPPSPYWNLDPGFQMHGNAPAPGYPACGYPYESSNYSNPLVPPYGTDWPWYNPVWPESQTTIVGERGIIHMFGGIQQYRRGYIHRSGTDPLNHPPGGQEWNIEEWLYDGTHGSTGYDKDYHWDDRIDYGMLPPHYPQVYEGMGSTSLLYSSSGWTMKVPPRH